MSALQAIPWPCLQRPSPCTSQIHTCHEHTNDQDIGRRQNQSEWSRGGHITTLNQLPDTKDKRMQCRCCTQSGSMLMTENRPKEGNVPAVGVGIARICQERAGEELQVHAANVRSQSDCGSNSTHPHDAHWKLSKRSCMRYCCSQGRCNVHT